MHPQAPWVWHEEQGIRLLSVLGLLGPASRGGQHMLAQHVAGQKAAVAAVQQLVTMVRGVVGVAGCVWVVGGADVSELLLLLCVVLGRPGHTCRRSSALLCWRASRHV